MDLGEEDKLKIPTTRHLKTKIGTLNYLRTYQVFILEPAEMLLEQAVLANKPPCGLPRPCRARLLSPEEAEGGVEGE